MTTSQSTPPATAIEDETPLPEQPIPSLDFRTLEEVFRCGTDAEIAVASRWLDAK